MVTVLSLRLTLTSSGLYPCKYGDSMHALLTASDWTQLGKAGQEPVHSASGPKLVHVSFHACRGPLDLPDGAGHVTERVPLSRWSEETPGAAATGVQESSAKRGHCRVLAKLKQLLAGHNDVLDGV